MSGRSSAQSGGGLRAVVFDMDGVLIDTEPVWRDVEIDVFGSLGVLLTEDDCRGTMGMRIDEVVRARYAQSPWTGATPEQVTARIVDGMVTRVSADGVALDGAREALATVRDMRLLCAVASSSPQRLIAAVLERLDLLDAADAVCSAEHEPFGKPAPDVYMRAAAALAVAPAACLAVEDSVNGVLSARAAGMPFVVIPDAQVAGDPRLDGAVLRLGSLRGLDRPTLERLSRDYFA
ncbi:MAG: hexitol phosphatase HxpB [Candidatus Dormibacteraeota bacterium]|nr:hexitol phosphatase HxpB [Candidatus Dormibacteraeota bacterium]